MWSLQDERNYVCNRWKEKGCGFPRYTRHIKGLWRMDGLLHVTNGWPAQEEATTNRARHQASPWYSLPGQSSSHPQFSRRGLTRGQILIIVIISPHARACCCHRHGNVPYGSTADPVGCLPVKFTGLSLLPCERLQRKAARRIDYTLTKTGTDPNWFTKKNVRNAACLHQNPR
jgi:hypothetical protein